MKATLVVSLAVFFALHASACLVSLQSTGTSDPNKLVKIYFPHAKPRSRGKAYVWWRARTNEPDGVFDGTFMTREQLIQAGIEIGGFTVGKDLTLTPRELPNPSAELSGPRKRRLSDHYRSTTTLLETTAENLRPFRPAVDRAIEKYGSLDKLLIAAGVTLEMTEGKRTALRRGTPRNRGGKYIVDSTGMIYFLTEVEMESLRSALGVEHLNHGVMGAILMARTGNNAVEILDYGVVKLVPERMPPQTLEPYQSRWNQGRDFDTLRYLLDE